MINENGIQMNMRRFLLPTIFIISLLILAGCAAIVGSGVSCGFSFDMRYDDQHAAVLDYLLMGEKTAIIGASKPPYVDKNHKSYFENIGYQYDRPRSLYLKWQDELTGNIHENTIDLRQSLPRDLDGTMLYFILHGSQVYVYLANLNTRVPYNPKNGSTMYGSFANIQLYPTLNK